METIETPTQAWPSVDAWARDTQHILTRVLPQMVQDSEDLRRRAGSAEAQATRLKREVEDLQNEITRLGAEVERLTAERAAMTETVHQSMAGIARLVEDATAALKER